MLLDQHEPVGVAVVERREEHAVHDGEDRGIRSDAERQREHRGQRQHGAPRQHANGVGEVPPEDVEVLSWGRTEDVRDRREPHARETDIVKSADAASRRCQLTARTRGQFDAGISALSTTTSRNGPWPGTTRSPHCSRTAVDNEGPANSGGAPGAAAPGDANG